MNHSMASIFQASKYLKAVAPNKLAISRWLMQCPLMGEPVGANIVRNGRKAGLILRRERTAAYRHVFTLLDCPDCPTFQPYQPC